MRGPRKAMRGKCERGLAFSAPWPRFHGVDRADTYIIIRVRACCCGECALNPPPSPPIPRRRSSLTPPHSDTPFPSTSAPPRSPDARPQTARCTPADLTTHSPPKTSPRPRTATRPSQALPLPHAAQTHARRLRHAFLADPTTHSPPKAVARPRSDTLPLLPFRFGHKKNGTAQCMCDAECLGRPSLRSVIWVGEPRAVRRRCGALACRRGA